MRFIASPHGMTNVLSTTQKFVVIDNEDFGEILRALNFASLLADQVENPTDLDGNPMVKGLAIEAVWAAHEAAGRAKWLQLVVS